MASVAHRKFLTQDFFEAKQHIYGLAHNVCFDASEQKQLLDVIKRIEQKSEGDGISHSSTVLAMLAPIEDGLVYGNWPWVKR